MHRPKAAWQVLTEKSFGGALLLAFLILSCGKANNSSSNPPPPPPANTEALSVDAGPTNSFVNGLFTTITVCAPGTSTCNTIDHVLVDTGSYGLRLLASGAAGGKLTLALSQQTNSTGAVAECAQFADSFTWGPVAIADVKISGEKASSVPIQVVGDANYPDSTAPTIASCTNGSTIPSGDTLGALGANGILGVGVFTDDCGPACASTTSNPGVYFACPSPPTSSSSCAVIAEPESSQLQNPVWMFSSDNNGLSISMPSVPPTEVGALTESGTLTFGIGTQSNNALGNAKVYTTDGFGNFTTNYSGSSYGTNGVPNSQSFIDSGSGAMFFLDPITTGIPGCTTCPTGASLAGLYCPPAPVNKSATNVGQNGTSGTVPFTVSSAATLICSTSNTAYSDLAGQSSLTFDWGMNFFYGKTVFVGIDGQTTPGGTGPYWAY